MLDLLDGKRSMATQTKFVQEQTVALPTRAVQASSASRPLKLSRSISEDKTGKRNLWLRGLDRLGLGFDS